MQKPLRILYICIAILAIPAFLIHLGLPAFIDDEAIRSMVAFEMWKTGNLIVPSIHGQLYLNKPPLYNWIILLLMKCFGQANEWTARIPTLCFLSLFTWTIYRYLKTQFSTRFAIFTALAFLTCGRILFWDSFLGLIDICFSWVIYLLFLAIYHYGQQQHWRKFWLSIYSLTAIAFLLKGVPAIVFGVLTTGIYIIFYRQWRRLFHPFHLAGIGIFVFLVGGYYYLYAAQTGGLANIFNRLMDESSKRTVVGFGWLETLKHLVTFPFEMIYHFLPWSLLSISLIRKDLFKALKSHPFILYMALIFAVNIPVYWSSPQVYPRYLLMLIPVYFTIVGYLAMLDLKAMNWRKNTLQIFYFVFAAVLVLAGFIPFFYDDLKSIIPNLYLQAIPVCIAMIVIFYFGIKWSKYRPELLILGLLIGRIAFNLFVLPHRAANDIGALSRKEAKSIGGKYQDKSVLIAGNQSRELMSMFYFSAAANQVIPVDTMPLKKGNFYIVDSTLINLVQFEVLDSFQTRTNKSRRFVISMK